MGDFLTAVKTVSLRQKTESERPLLQEIVPVAKPLVQVERSALNSPEDTLEVLRSRPDTDSLEDVLLFLSKRQNRDGFNIRVPSPLSAKIINELISTTLPDFWQDIGDLEDLLLEVLRSVAGIGALVAKLRLLLSQYKPTKQTVQTSHATQSIVDTISVLSHLLASENTTHRIYTDITRLVDNQAKRSILWKEYLAAVATGRVVSAVAQAEDITNTSEKIREKSWLSDGPKYSTWLGRNVAYMVQQASTLPDNQATKGAAQLCAKAFNIGYAAQVVAEVHSLLSFSNSHSISLLVDLLDSLQSHEQRQFLQLTMKFLSQRDPMIHHPGPDVEDDFSSTPPFVSGSASLLHAMVSSQHTKTHLISWLSDPAVNCNEPFAARRAAIAALVSTGGTRSIMDEDLVQKVLESSWKLFGDYMFIKHTPIVQQEACAQTLLICAGYVHRTQPMFLFTLARSSVHMAGTSNRLNTSSLRARFLGMVVGMAISALVDKQESKLKFDLEDVRTPEADLSGKPGSELRGVRDENCY